MFSRKGFHIRYLQNPSFTDARVYTDCIRDLYRVAPETVKRATHAYKGRYFLDSVSVSVVFRAIQLTDNVLLKLKIISYIQI